MKMAKTLLICQLLLISFTLTSAQVIKPDTLTHWKKKLVFNLNLNQAAFSSNWKAGGVNSIGLNSLFNYKASYAKDKLTWDSEIDLLFGFVNNSGQGYRKTLDRIFLDTKIGRKISSHWDLYTSLNFSTQFAPGYKYTKDAGGIERPTLISDIFAPAFITSAWGFAYHPTDYFNVRISPFAPRFTIVSDPARFIPGVDPESPYGVTPPDQVRVEFLAFQMQAEFNKDIAPNLNLKWRYLVFANYETLSAKNIDHRLDINLSARVNKFISVGLGGILLYDSDQDKEIQVSQAFNIGFAYSFQNFEEKK